jgi:hypothetical protein
VPEGNEVLSTWDSRLGSSIFYCWESYLADLEIEMTGVVGLACLFLVLDYESAGSGTCV